jgi:uncharacterized protein (UPF0335 family)
MTSDAQIRAFIDRILRLKEEQDTIGEDIRDIYAEAKSMGFDKTAMGNVVAHLRKVAKKGSDTVAEQGAIFDLYLCAYEGKSPHAPAPARVRENIEQFDPTTGEIIEADVSAKLVETIAAGVQTEVGRAALIAAVDIMIAREEEEGTHERPSTNDEPSPEAGPQAEASPAGTGAGMLADREGRHEGEAASAGLPTNSETPSDVRETDRETADTLAGANAGGEDVDGSAERADINAVASASGPDDKRASNSPEQAPEFLTKAEEEAEAKGAATVDAASRANEESDRQRASGAGPADGRQHGGGDPLAAAGDHAPSFIAKPKFVLRPHCLNPGENCGGYGDKHCHGCTVAIRGKAEEVA